MGINCMTEQTIAFPPPVNTGFSLKPDLSISSSRKSSLMPRLPLSVHSHWAYHDTTEHVLDSVSYQTCAPPGTLGDTRSGSRNMNKKGKRIIQQRTQHKQRSAGWSTWVNVQRTNG